MARVNALLHPHDVADGYTMISDEKEVPPALANSTKVITRGSHVTVRHLITPRFVPCRGYTLTRTM
jgi:hypothetical protein